MTQRWIIPLRFGKKADLERFRQAGEVYMNSLRFFTELENDPLRADRDEGISHLFQPGSLEMIFDSPLTGKFRVNPDELLGPVRLIQNEDFNVNVFCMYAITTTVDGEQVVDPKVREFGDSVVLILNLQEFLNRVGIALTKEGLSGEAKLVEYYNPETHTGSVGAFKKSSVFAYQQEFRLAVRPGIFGPRILSLGSLEDITSEIMPVSQINQRLDFTENSAREAGLI